MDYYEVCENETTPGEGTRYETLDEAMAAAQEYLTLLPHETVFVTIHRPGATPDASTTVYDSRWPSAPR
jgi:hypothetical protein